MHRKTGRDKVTKKTDGLSERKREILCEVFFTKVVEALLHLHFTFSESH